MRLLVSIPVHEQFNVVMDQVENVQLFNPSATVVLHISREFKNRFLSRAQFVESERLLVNPTRLSTARQGLLPIHLSNYLYARDKAAADAFVLNASNDMYVSHGAARYIASHDAIVRPVPLAQDSDWAHIEKVRKHGYLRRLVDHLGGGEICASTPEGTAFPRALMDEMAEILTTRLPYESPSDAYPDEETVLPTIAARLASRLGLPFVMSEVTVGRKLDIGVIDEVRARTFHTPPKTFYGSAAVYPVYDNSNLFAVKRVARRFDDPMRAYIRGLSATA
ncbi:MAG: hypothetical protein ABI612_00320 [Betaproteobacteria bacterium]